MDNFFNYVSEHQVVIIAGLFFISELLADLNVIKSNSIFQLLRNSLKNSVKKALPEIERKIDAE